MKRQTLLTEGNAKTVKGEKKGYLTKILYLAPSDESRVMNVCPFATPGCKAGCLSHAGRAAIFEAIPAARIKKTRFLHSDRAAFMAQLVTEVRAAIKRAARKGMTLAIRVNGTSDLPFMAHQLAEQFPDVQFYDYTKIPAPWKRTRANYHLTFSHSETNHFHCLDALYHGINVAVVFDVKRGHALPATWEGYRVIDGDETDLRFTDEHGVVVGLRAKGPAKKDCTGFVVSTAKLVNIAHS